MSSTDPPTRSWWSLYKASSDKESRQNYMDIKSERRSSNVAKHSSGLKSIAVAIGLKSKRPSKEPLYPVDGSQASSGRKSPSPGLSPVTELEPFDTRLRRPRQSLLTLADDPFAGHPPVVSIYQSPVPSRFSIYSSPSVTDSTSSKIDSPVYRSSYGSSSTTSNSLGPDLNSTAMSNSHRFPESKKLHLKRSIGSMQVKLQDSLSHQSSFSSISREPPLSDEAPVRPKLRSRGMTIGGLPQKSGFFVKEQTTQRKLSQASNNIPAFLKPESSSKPVPPIRQTPISSSRIFAPPTAPPAVGLPAPPQTISEQPDFPQRKGMDPLLPFPSSSPPSLVDDYITFLHDGSRASKQNLPGDDCSFSGSVEPSSKTPPSHRTLKKLPSQRSLRRTSSPSSSMSSKTTTTLDPSEKRKQRNSQQCRLPMPTLSLSIRTSFVSTQPRTGDPSSPYSTTDQRKSRKRLFSSGSQRPSMLTRIPTSPREDDTSSVSSLRSDHDTIHTPYKPWVVTRNYPKPSSFWDEGSDTTPNSPAPPRVDYQPQAIMSRDELAKLEASISNANPEQETPLGSTFPFPPSTGPEIFEQGPSRVALSPPPFMKPEASSGWSSDATLTSSTSRFRIARRPFTADPLGRDSSKETELGFADARRHVAHIQASRLDVMPDSTSLPPPPRRRLLSSNSVRSTTSTSTSSTLVPSPVERLNSKIKLVDRPNTVTTATPLQPSTLGSRSLPTTTIPVPRSSRAKVRTSGVLEKAIHRRSIMRKPSFLEIDAETDPESETEVAEKRDSLFLNMNPPVANGSSKTCESFLDLARESFDTIRS